MFVRFNSTLLFTTLIIFSMLTSIPSLSSAHDKAIADNTETSDPVLNIVNKATSILPKKKELDFLHWGFEQRVRQEYIKNGFRLSKQETNPNYFRFRTRLWFELTPAQWIDFYVRFTDEFRAWMTPHAASDLSEVVFDNIYFTIKRPFDLPVSIRFGRQDIVYGNGFILKEGTPMDGSRTMYFDGIKSTLHLDSIKTDIDALVLETNRNDRKFFKFNPSDFNLVEDEIRAYGYYITSNYFDNIKLEQYYLYKRANGQPFENSDFSDNEKLNTFGARISGSVCDNFSYESELAVQTGRQGPLQRTGLGTYVLGKYKFPICFSPALTAGYFYLSGDDPDTDKREDWDPLFGRWTQPLQSELMLFTYIREGGIARWTNMHKFRLAGELQPVSWCTLSVMYDRMLADENTYIGTTGFGSGKTRGNLLTFAGKFKFNKQVTALGYVEYFDPGDYYARTADPALFLRWELKFKY